MKKKQKVLQKLMAVVLAASMMVALGACGSGNDTKASTETKSSTASTTSAENTDSGKAQKLKVLNWGNLDEEKVFTAAIERFKASHAGVEVEHTIVPVESWSDFIQKWITMCSSGQAPDLINIGLEGVQLAVKNQLILPFDEIVANDNDLKTRLDQYPDAILKGFKVNDKLYGMPNGSQTMVMYYNKDIFDKNGIKYPTDNWTWDEFKEKAKALSYGEGDSKVYGFGLPVAYFQLTPWWVTNGAYPVSDDYSKPTLTSDAMVESVTFLSDLVKGGISPSPMGSDVYNQFAAGKLAMVGAGRWVLNNWQKSGLKNFDCVQWPQKTKSGTVYGAAAWGIGSKTANKDLAIALLKEFISDETLKATAGLGQQIPPTEALATNPDLMGTVPDHVGLLWKSVTNSTAVAAPTYFGDIEKALLRALEKVFSGSASPKDALSQAQNEVEAAIAQQ